MTEQAAADLKQHQEAVAGVVRDVFTTMLGSEAWLAEDQQRSPEKRPIVGAVYFAGSWKGAVLVEFEPAPAFAAAAHLLGVPVPSQVDADVRDAIGEVANMLAGNLKSILPPETVMSMPSVVEGADFTVSVLGANRSSRLNFETPRGRFRLTLVEMQPN